MTTEADPSPATGSEGQSSKVSRWIVILAALVLVGVVGVVIYGYLARPGWVGVSGKQFWDYLDLLIVPAALALGVAWLNQEQRARELEVENQRAQDEALRAYIDSMENLLLEKNLRSSAEGSELRLLARARTLTILPRLDGNRKGSVLQFLYEAGLIARGEAIIRLKGANLEGTIAPRTIVLRFRTARRWSLQGISETSDVETGANLSGAALDQVNLSKANLENARLAEASLSFTNLSEANLSGANLSGALLGGAILNGANLRDATMPNGEKYEDWVKSREEDGEQ